MEMDKSSGLLQPSKQLCLRSDLPDCETSMVWATQKLAPSLPEHLLGRYILLCFPSSFNFKLWSWRKEWVRETCNLEGTRAYKPRKQEPKPFISPLSLHIASLLCLEQSCPICSPGELLCFTSNITSPGRPLPATKLLYDPLMPNSSPINNYLTLC